MLTGQVEYANIIGDLAAADPSRISQRLVHVGVACFRVILHGQAGRFELFRVKGCMHRTSTMLTAVVTIGMDTNSIRAFRHRGSRAEASDSIGT